MSTISAGTTSTTTLIHSGDTTGSLVLKTNDTGSGGTTAVTIGTDQSFNFSATGQRITGDFSNATFANRVAFQTSTTNGATTVLALPNGTGTTASWDAYNNSDPTNSSYFALSALSTEARLSSTIRGTGTFLPMTFYTNGSERMRIDTSGNVGIGTSSPATALSIYRGATAAVVSVDGDSSAVFRATRYTTDTNPSEIVARKARGTLAAPTTVATSDIAGGVFFQAYGGTNFRNIGRIDGLVQTYTSDTNIAGALAFYTNAGSTDVTERMRIDSSGYLLINQTSNVTSSYLQIKGAQPAISCESTSTGSVSQVLFRNPNGQVGSISTSGSSTSYNTSSDYRLKQDIVPMTGALATVAQLKPVTYKWKVDGSGGQGFIAHELQEVCPDAVTGSKDAVDENGKPEYQGIDTSFLVATLTAALQELKALVDTQASTITQLQADVAALKGTS